MSVHLSKWCLYLASENEKELNIYTYNMVGVKVKDNESIDRAVNRFKKLVARSRILNEYKDNQQYTKPSKERREALKKSIRDQKRRQRHQY